MEIIYVFLYIQGYYGDLTERKALRESLHCHDFQWYLDNVYPDLFVPNQAIAFGEVGSYVSTSGFTGIILFSIMSLVNEFATIKELKLNAWTVNNAFIHCNVIAIAKTIIPSQGLDISEGVHPKNVKVFNVLTSILTRTMVLHTRRARIIKNEVGEIFYLYIYII